MGARLRSVPQHHSVLSDGARTEPVCHQGPRCIAPPAGVPSACLVFKLFACLSPTQNCWPPPTQPCRCVRSRCSEASRGKGGMLGQRAHPLERSRSEGPLPPPRKSSRPGLETWTNPALPPPPAACGQAISSLAFCFLLCDTGGWARHGWALAAACSPQHRHRTSQRRPSVTAQLGDQEPGFESRPLNPHRPYLFPLHLLNSWLCL